MRFDSYIFRDKGEGYEQYPKDYTTELFKKIHEISNGRNCLVTHRKYSLVYYTYIKFNNGASYVGYCFVVNGCYISNPVGLIDILEKAVGSTASMSKQKNEYDELIKDIGYSSELPAQDFSIGAETCVEVDRIEKTNDIINKINKFPYVVIPQISKGKKPIDDNNDSKIPNGEGVKSGKWKKIFSFVIAALMIVVVVEVVLMNFSKTEPISEGSNDDSISSNASIANEGVIFPGKDVNSIINRYEGVDFATINNDSLDKILKELDIGGEKVTENQRKSLNKIKMQVLLEQTKNR